MLGETKVRFVRTVNSSRETRSHESHEKMLLQVELSPRLWIVAKQSRFCSFNGIEVVAVYCPRKQASKTGFIPIFHPFLGFA